MKLHATRGRLSSKSLLEPRTFAAVRLDLIKSNFTRLVANWPSGVPMVKCNAYGHGLVEVARALASQKKTLAFGVASVEEGISLRDAGLKSPIWVFSDCGPWSAERAAALSRFGLTPILQSVDDVDAALAPRYRGLIESAGIHLKFNTGMNRLGIAASEAGRLRRLIEKKGLRVSGVCSHLASSEAPRSGLTRRQRSAFEGVVREFSSHNVSYIHCSNSGGLLNEEVLELERLCNVVRPGIGLYGYGGAAGETLGLRPALSWYARVLAYRQLAKGEAVGYGGTFVTRKSTPQSVLAVGYGDGFKRALSNHEVLLGKGKRLMPAGVLGRVSMDLTAIGLRARPGEWVTLLGQGRAQGEAMAAAAGTVVYEILTSISSRVPRLYSAKEVGHS